MMWALAPQTPIEYIAQSSLRLESFTLVEDAIPDLPSIAGLQLPHQRRQKIAKYIRSGTRRVGGRQRRLRYRASAKMVKLVGVALQVSFDLTQTARPAK